MDPFRWRPRSGEDPSHREAVVLRALCLLWAQKWDAYGPTVKQLRRELQAPIWAPSEDAVRAHLRNLHLKGLAYVHDRRAVGGSRTWQPSDRGRLFIAECSLPCISKIGASRRRRVEARVYFS